MTAAVILAGGRAQRAGGPKIVWPVAGLPAVRRVALAALGAEGIDTVVAVTGRWRAEAAEALAGLPLTLIQNPDYMEGQSTSLRAGLAAVPAPAAAAIFLLADQPFITSQIIADLVKFHYDQPGAVTLPFFQGARQSPAVFDLTRFRAELMALKGDQGGRGLIAAHPAEVNLWPADHLPPACFMDFDTLEEYGKLIQT